MFLVFAAFIIYMLKVLELRMTESQYQNATKDNGHGYVLNAEQYETNRKTMNYVEIGNDTLPMVLLIHGSPSSSASWKELMGDSLMLSKARLVAVDRPGYGFSSFGEVETSVLTQAEKIIPILEKKRIEHDEILVIGSSYGGPVAVAIAALRPDLINGLMLQSSSMKPKAEKIYPISYPTSRVPLKYLIPTVFRNANTEKLTHENALNELLPYWNKITAPTLIFHGNKDDLIYFENATFAQDQLVNAKKVKLKEIEGEGHGMLWSDFELTRNTMIEAIDLMQSEDK